MRQTNKRPTVSIVVPVYNEEAHLFACLESISRQTQRPDEVIVVDNNSTDSSAFIASTFPFVRLIPESRQGIVHARNRGFNAASGDIIARIDGDSTMPEHWVEQMTGYLLAHPEYAGVSGKYDFYDAPFKKLVSANQVLMYQYMQKMMTGSYFLCGANMALRRRDWRAVRAYTSRRSDIDEDIDLTLHLRRNGFKIGFDKTIEVATPFVAERRSAIDAYKYLMTWPRDYALHGMPLRSAFLFMLVCFILVSLWPMYVMSYLETWKNMLTYKGENISN